MSPSSDSIQHKNHVMDALDSGIVILGGDHRVLTWNVWMERATDVAQTTLIGRSIWDVFPALLDTRFSDAIGDALHAGASSILTHSLHSRLLPLHLPDGRPLLHDLIIRPLPSQSGRQCLIQVKDVTVTVERERLLRERRDAKYRAVVDTAQDAIVTTDAGGTVQWMNSAAERTFAMASQDAVGRDITHLLSPGGDVPWPRNLEALALRESSAQPVELTVERHDGTVLNLELSLARWQSENRNFLTGILRDVTERRRVRDALEQAVADKTVLLREINHRVKNSLQLVSGLLNLQMASLVDKSARSLLKEASDRIAAVARVHHRLYQTDRFRTLDFAAFLDEMCDDLIKASGERVCDIHLATEPLEVSIDHAAPLGLITNELITNAIKHRGADPAVIKVTLECWPDGYALTVSDQGPGLPPGFDAAKSRTLGMRIVTALTRQIGGTLEIPPVARGTTFRITVSGHQHSCTDPEDGAP
ncbi:PAS domain S-box protein [Skermanella mucosa]|uniref:sensor histidine kinase n=1 Tax=Skermanella mucosa TaxID=1789672 RepID=UPI00192ADBDD|nr:histidine kinase dimerization/phosphoacceptor domain -containing protein [Skermanella mucosa]UEM23705.1 PAS domain S-box protein [Skermanella mucosa]